MPFTPAGATDLRARILAAGVVQPLMQLAVVGSPPAVQGPANEALQVGGCANVDRS